MSWEIEKRGSLQVHRRAGTHRGLLAKTTTATGATPGVGDAGRLLLLHASVPVDLLDGLWAFRLAPLLPPVPPQVGHVPDHELQTRLQAEGARLEQGMEAFPPGGGVQS